MARNFGITYGSFSVTKHDSKKDEEEENEFNYQTGIHVRKHWTDDEKKWQTGSNWQLGFGLNPSLAPAIQVGKMSTDVALPSTGWVGGLRHESKEVTPINMSGDRYEIEEHQICRRDPNNPSLLYKRERTHTKSSKIGNHLRENQTKFGFQF